MKKRLLSILLVLLMALTLLPLGALADENSKCGESLTWNLDEIGILTISGTGDMYNYSSAYPAPWSAKNNDISEIIVLDGVTSIGNNAFHSCSTLSMVTFMGGLTRIGSGAFAGCEALGDFDFPYNLETIGANAFSNCNNLIDVTIRQCSVHRQPGFFLLRRAAIGLLTANANHNPGRDIYRLCAA